jgi:hypothetical protein
MNFGDSSFEFLVFFRFFLHRKRYQPDIGEPQKRWYSLRKALGIAKVLDFLVRVVFPGRRWCRRRAGNHC